jgi:hypothetical protein
MRLQKRAMQGLDEDAVPGLYPPIRPNTFKLLVCFSPCTTPLSFLLSSHISFSALSSHVASLR